jgi:acyl-homoserine lactone acylase PvdQ
MMNVSAEWILRNLGEGVPIATVAEAAGMARGEFDAWWRGQLESRVPETGGTRQAAVRAAVRIDRDRWGIPHISAQNDPDLFFGFGFAQAQDRLFQLDYLRRKGSGRLAEILGPGVDPAG